VYFIVAKIVFSQQLFTFANLKVGHSQRQEINNFQVSFEQNTVPTGMYLVDIFTENQRVTKKLVIE
jgi:hypothetical protein